MEIGDRIKLIRGEISREKFAPMTKVAKNTLVNYENGISAPQSNFLNKILELYPYINPAWLLTGQGEMRRPEVNGHVANGNNNIQGAHIDADELHLNVHQVNDPSGPTYADPIDGLFIKDWKRLSETGQMRVWTLLKEEIEREREKKEGL